MLMRGGLGALAFDGGNGNERVERIWMRRDF